MGETIKLDSAHRAAVRGIAKDSILTCSKTSAPDVFVNGSSLIRKATLCLPATAWRFRKQALCRGEYFEAMRVTSRSRQS